MEDYLGKEYILVSAEYLEEYLAFIGISYFYRKLALSLKPVHSLTQNGDGTYTFAFKSKVAKSEATFIPGEEFVETKADGVKVKALITFKGNIMTHLQTERNGRTSKHIREFYPDKLIITTTVEGFDKTVIRIHELI